MLALFPTLRSRAIAGLLGLSLALAGLPAAAEQLIVHRMHQGQHEHGFWTELKRGLMDGLSSPQINGSGRTVDDPRSVEPFSKVVVHGPFDVRFKASSTSTRRVSVHADDNIAPLIETVVTGGALVVGVRKDVSFRTRSKVYVNVEAPTLSSVTLRGSGDLRADTIRTDVFEATIQGSGDLRIESLEANVVAVSISGSGDFRARGRSGSLGIAIAGSGDVYSDGLEAEQVAVRIRGSGDVRVHATKSLQVDISGSGDVRYRGDPQIAKKVAGSGDVRPLK